MQTEIFLVLYTENDKI